MPSPSGLYRHFKHRAETGTVGLYRVLALASDVETLDPCVVYQSLHDHRAWVRPLAEFTSVVVRTEGQDGGPYTGPRFIALRPEEASAAVRPERAR